MISLPFSGKTNNSCHWKLKLPLPFQHKAPCILHCGGRKLNQFIPRCVELWFDGSKWCDRGMAVRVVEFSNEG